MENNDFEYLYVQYNEDLNDLTNKIENLVKKLQRLSKKKFVLCRSMALQIIDDNVRNQKYIEHVLDNLLDVLTYYEDPEALLIYKHLCNHYFYINPEATQNYIELYREQCDPKGEKIIF